ncbi:MAG: hypothetical protein QNK32_06500, partial [Porticoccus sp.]|nr:hypothetical protein [Porticoccus sp.]
MTMIELQSILPLIVLSIVIVLLMLLIAFRREHVLTAVSTVVGLLLTLASVPLAVAVGPQQMSLLSVDAYGVFFTVLL